MIGYYVHHHGRGHLSRALAIAAELDTDVTLLSSVSRPAEWDGCWVDLPLDRSDDPVDAGAAGRLHWVPLHSAGLRTRMAAVAEWIATARPRAIVVDVSVEVAVLARLHGVPVISIALPGRRGDAAHTLAFDISTAIIGAWPPEATGMVHGLAPETEGRIHAVGAIGRQPLAVADAQPRLDRKPQVLVLSGAGGDDFSSMLAREGDAQAVSWSWSHLGGSSGRWSADPRDEIRAADVVVTHAGEGSLADVAAARRPAIVIPQDRPHDEQQLTAQALGRGRWPVIVLDTAETQDWTTLLDDAAKLDGDAWTSWNDGEGAARAAAAVERVIAENGVRP